MKLNYKKIGSGKPLFILHGLFGLLDNWQSLGKNYAEAGFEVYLIDQRNHGHSSHASEWNYKVMSDDLIELMHDNHLNKINIIGHSMGGKAAMYLAVTHPQLIEKLIVADIAPRYYPIHHHAVLNALNTLNLEAVTSRKEAEQHLTTQLNEASTVQFLLKNLYWDSNEPPKLKWRFNLPVITQNIEIVGEAMPQPTQELNFETLFIRGERSNYINDSDLVEINNLFASVRIETIKDAGHWVHAEKPKDFFETTTAFLNK